MGCSLLGTGQDGDGQQGRAESSIQAPNYHVPSLVPTCCSRVSPLLLFSFCIRPMIPPIAPLTFQPNTHYHTCPAGSGFTLQAS